MTFPVSLSTTQYLPPLGFTIVGIFYPQRKRWGRRSRARVIDGPENETQTNRIEFNLYFSPCQVFLFTENKKADQSHFESLLTFVSVWMVGVDYISRLKQTNFPPLAFKTLHFFRHRRQTN